jgi:hypothetical protein
MLSHVTDTTSSCPAPVSLCHMLLTQLPPVLLQYLSLSLHKADAGAVMQCRLYAGMTVLLYIVTEYCI